MSYVRLSRARILLIFHFDMDEKGFEDFRCTYFPRFSEPLLNIWQTFEELRCGCIPRFSEPLCSDWQVICRHFVHCVLWNISLW